MDLMNVDTIEIYKMQLKYQTGEGAAQTEAAIAELTAKLPPDLQAQQLESANHYADATNAETIRQLEVQKAATDPTDTQAIEQTDTAIANAEAVIRGEPVGHRIGEPAMDVADSVSQVEGTPPPETPSPEEAALAERLDAEIAACEADLDRASAAGDEAEVQRLSAEIDALKRVRGW
jgi:hypothetical protein